MQLIVLLFLFDHVLVEFAEKLQGFWHTGVVVFVGSIDKLPTEQVKQDVPIVQFAVWLRLCCQPAISLELLSTRLYGWHTAVVGSTRLIDQITKFVSIELRSQCVIPLLHWFILQVVYLEEIKGSLVSTVN